MYTECARLSLPNPLRTPAPSAEPREGCRPESGIPSWESGTRAMGWNLDKLHEGNIGLLAQLCAVHGRLVKIWSSEGSANATLVVTYRMLSNSLGMLGWEGPQSARPDNRQSKQANRFAANAANNVRG